jgi:hypothetical protein
VEFVVAVRKVDFGEDRLTPSGAPTTGYDLDDKCTCTTDGSSCKLPDFVLEPVCDGPGGRDNATALLFNKVSNFNKDLKSSKHSERANAGEWSLLFRVRNYNGQADDAEVTVSIHPSPGMHRDPCLIDVPPAWDGSDQWPIDANSFLDPSGSGGSNGGGNGGNGGNGGGGNGGNGGGGGLDCDGPKDTKGYDLDAPRYFDLGAYVANNVLVANLPKTPLALTGQNSYNELLLTAGFITGRLEKQGAQWFMREGVLAGRWHLDDIFLTFGAALNGGTGLCTDHSLYPLLREAICAHIDVAAALAGPTTPCDAVSFGMEFEAEPAKFGLVFESLAMPTTCPPDKDPVLKGCTR